MAQLDFLVLDKRALLRAILDELCNIRDMALASAEQARLTATHSENAAQSRYDTLGLEGAYLAHGQSQRVVECEQDIAAFKDMPLIKLAKEDPVSLGSLILLELSDNSRQYLYLCSRGGGVKVLYKTHTITLVTSSSPIGQALLGKFWGDEVLMTVSGERKYFVISNLI